MSRVKTFAFAGAAILAVLAAFPGSQALAASERAVATLASRSANLDTRPRVVQLKCNIQRAEDGVSRVVIVNPHKYVVPKGTTYTYTIMGQEGVEYSTFQGRMESDMKPNDRLADEFQQEIVSCRATIRLAG